MLRSKLLKGPSVSWKKKKLTVHSDLDWRCSVSKWLTWSSLFNTWKLQVMCSEELHLPYLVLRTLRKPWDWFYQRLSLCTLSEVKKGSYALDTANPKPKNIWVLPLMYFMGEVTWKRLGYHQEEWRGRGKEGVSGAIDLFIKRVMWLMFSQDYRERSGHSEAQCFHVSHVIIWLRTDTSIE